MSSRLKHAINNNGHLEIGGMDTVELAQKYGTPLMVYDEQAIRERCRTFVDAFKEKKVKAQVAYASKAFNCVAICQLMEQEGLSLDVVSGGELYTALQAQFPSEKIHFHGNNKTKDELLLGLDAKIGCFVVDNFYELELLHKLASERNQQVNILLRISPGVEAHTHEYISTGQEDSKFGFDLASGQVKQALAKATQLPFYNVLGLHAHIGSQIFETEGFALAIEKMAKFLDESESELNWELSVLNVGGGFGIRYNEEDKPLAIHQYVYAICDKVQQLWSERNKPMPEVWIEPGRSIVGDTATTLYTVGSKKTVPGIREYLSIDGGMSDNLRVALYQAKYEAALANKMNEANDFTYTVAGKLCETGDVLIHDAQLPEAVEDDVLAVFCTGAYGYSMANNYNRMKRPAVLFVKDGHAQTVIKRETYEDIIKNDVAIFSKVISD
ncbi:diaminopimelate decarboxylase [Bacillus horti]|uniref:Diaminopimelate decarboxylase n=1 Tax=Caldalkalibacillus horti TaxID=77523 RepID=A0ABT9VU79_9BACI|nr:diaminopimelate decarboxylase [Bacillus horti]MDQ0164542.1 diaminopimelate decarboxylase [Bacillus horti]